MPINKCRKATKNGGHTSTVITLEHYQINEEQNVLRIPAGNLKSNKLLQIWRPMPNSAKGLKYFNPIFFD
jgi:hypothetical protein